MENTKDSFGSLPKHRPHPLRASSRKLFQHRPAEPRPSRPLPGTQCGSHFHWPGRRQPLSTIAMTAWTCGGSLATSVLEHACPNVKLARLCSDDAASGLSGRRRRRCPAASLVPHPLRERAEASEPMGRPWLAGQRAARKPFPGSNTCTGHPAALLVVCMQPHIHVGRGRRSLSKWTPIWMEPLPVCC